MFSRLSRRVLATTPFVFGVLLGGSALAVPAAFNSAADIPITGAGGYTATGTVELSLNFTPAVGTFLTVVENTGVDFINGTFSNLAQGQSVSFNVGGAYYRFVADYFGGSGNDLVLVWASNRMMAWGQAAMPLGVNPQTGEDVQVPTAVDVSAGLPGGRTVLAIESGSTFTLALCSDGTVLSWGFNHNGELGVSQFAGSRGVPGPVNQTAVLAGKRVIAISAGSDHALALCSDGTVAAWGGNQYGQIGNNSTATAYAPVLLSGGALAGKKVVAVSAGKSFSLALCSDGTVVAWGRNNNSPVAVPVTVTILVPSQTPPFDLVPQIVPLTGIKNISAGASHSLALKTDGTVVAWGENGAGQLGNGVVGGPEPQPVAVDMGAGSALAGRSVKSISAGYRESGALCTDGTLVSWGYYPGHALNSGTALPVAVPATGVLAGKTVTAQVARFGMHNALCSDGTLVAWGYNYSTALGMGPGLPNEVLPDAVSSVNLLPGEKFSSVTRGADSIRNFALVSFLSSLEIAVEHTLDTELADGAGTIQFGSVESGYSASETLTVRNLGNSPLHIESAVVTGTAAGDFTISGAALPLDLAASGAIGIKVTFAPSAVGTRSAALQLVSADADESPFDLTLTGTGVAVNNSAVNVTYTTGLEVPVTAARYHASGRSASFTLNHLPVAGRSLMVVNNTGLEYIAGPFNSLPQGQVVHLAFGGMTYDYVADYFGGTGNDLVLVWADNHLMAWGAENVRLGRGPGAGNVLLPMPVSTTGVLNGKTLLKVSTSQQHTLALCSDGTLAGWGFNNFGVLGIGSSEQKDMPFPVNQTGVLAGKRIIEVACGDVHSVVLCSDGTLAAWGNNDFGQLGTGTKVTQMLPVLVDRTGVLAGRTVISLKAGRQFTLVLCADGTLAAWGRNVSGQLGDGTTNDSAVPVTVVRAGTPLAGRTVSAFCAGYDFALALTSDGTFVGWGGNGNSQLGRGQNDSVNYPLPVAVGTGNSVLATRQVVSLSAGQDCATALCTSGEVVAWGRWPGVEFSGQPPYSSPVVVDSQLHDSTPDSALNGKTVVSHHSHGWAHAVICSDGSLATWGNNFGGALGTNNTEDSQIPIGVNTSLLTLGDRFVSVSTGPTAYFTTAIVASIKFVEIAVESGAQTYIDGTTVADFGSVLTGTSAARSFTIKNLGSIDLTGLTLTIDGPAADDFDVTVAPVAPVATAQSTSFTVEFTGGALGPRNAVLHILNNDPDEGSFEIPLTAVCYGIPNIAVNHQGAGLYHGAVVSMGGTPVGVPKVRAFTVRNVGTGPLMNLSAEVSNPDSFTLSKQLPASLAPGASAQLEVTMHPPFEINTGCSLSIYSDDPDRGLFSVSISGSGVPVTPQEIRVLAGATELTDNQAALPIGNVSQGVAKEQVFTISNSGSQLLTGFGLTVSGANASDFTVEPAAATSLGKDDAATFKVIFVPSAPGARAASVRIASNDADENPFDINLTGTGTVPEIAVEQAGASLTDGSATISFGSALVVGTPVTKSLVIKNLGTADLIISGGFLDGAHAGDFQLGEPQGGGGGGGNDEGIVLTSGGSITVPIILTPSASGVRTAALHILNNDSNESPFDIKFTGECAAPEIAIEQPPGTNLVDDDSLVNFGPALQGTDVVKTFTIKNPGTALLASIAITVSGADAARFTVTTQPPATLAAKGSTTFAVKFTPDAEREFNAKLLVASNDYDENPFEIAVTGEGVSDLKPVFDTHPASQIVEMGKPATFTAAVSSPTPVTHQWRKGTATFSDIAGAKALTYSIAAAKATDAAVQYRLRTTSTGGFTESNPAHLTVVDGTDKVFNLLAGSKATFTAIAASSSTLTYTWKKDGADLPVDARYVVGPPSQLVINNVNEDDAATYTCEVTGPGGTLAGGDNVLTVFDAKPKILPKPVVMTDAIVGGDYSFFVPLDPNEGTATAFTATPLPAGLKLNAVTGEIYGKPTTSKPVAYSFTVTAKNSMGTDTATATLLVKPLPLGADGDYVGIVARGPVNESLGGRVDLKIASTGIYSGKITFGSKSHTLAAGSVTTTLGGLLVTGSATVASSTLKFDFTIDTAAKRFSTATVSLGGAGGAGGSAVTGWRNTWNATTQATEYDDYYTFALDRPLSIAGNLAYPQGLGYGSFKVPLKGESFAIAGKTADGDAFTSSAFLGPFGELACYCSLPSKGTLSGVMDIVPGTGPGFNDNVLDGGLTWSRPASTAASAGTYKDGFGAIALEAVGGRYLAPAANVIVLGKTAGTNNAMISFFDADIGGPPSRADRSFTLVPGASITIAASGPALTSVKITPATGALSGGFTLVDSHPVTPSAARITRKVTFQGILVSTPAVKAGYGYFLMPQLPAVVYPPPPVLPVLSGGLEVD